MADNDPISSAGAGYSDIDRWRLAVLMNAQGMKAWLKDRYQPESAARELVSAMTSGEKEDILQRLENAVYDHPSVLDDFEADIVIDTVRVLAAPAAATDDDSEAAEVLSQIYACETADVFTDRLPQGVNLVHSLCPGLRPFLMRTFPGSRVTSTLGVYLRHWMKMPKSANCVCAHAAADTLWFAAFDGRGSLLLTGGVAWNEPMDIAYHCLNAATAAKLNPKEAVFLISADNDITAEETIRTLGNYSDTALATPMPTEIKTSGLPIVMALALQKDN